MAPKKTGLHHNKTISIMIKQKKDLLAQSVVPIEIDEAGFEREDTGIEELSKPLDSENLRIRTDQPTIQNIIDRLKENEIDMNPDFQRKSGLWKNDRKSRLIESLMLFIPLPAFYVDATTEGRWIIIDGLQRLTTLKEYVIDDAFPLEGLEFLDQCKGKKFSQLERKYQRRITETQVTVSKIEEGTDEDIKYTIFRRINTGGLLLSPQEIRHALNQGKITEFLKELSEKEYFKEAPWNKIRCERMEDRECIIRFLAFYHKGTDAYTENSFDNFLNNCMKEFNKADEVMFKKLEKAFCAAIKRATELFGENAFCRPSTNKIQPFNKAIFETWCVALARLSKADWDRLLSKKNDINDLFGKLLKDTRISDSFTAGTGQIGRVKTRFTAIENFIRNTIDKGE